MDIKHLTSERGASLVEAALVIPLLLVMLLGVSDMGPAYHTYITVINAAREGARYGVSHASDTAGIRARVIAEAQLSDVDLSGATISVSNGGSGHPIRVTVRTDYPVLLGTIFGRMAFPISYSVAFRVR
jgi:Flp pilus assembly protein TadG